MKQCLIPRRTYLPVSNETMDLPFPQYLISDPWKNSQFGSFTIQTGKCSTGTD